MTIPKPLLQRFSDQLAARMGLYFPPPRWPDLLRGLQQVASEFGFCQAEPCLRWLLAADLSQCQVEILARYLVVGETYFFRDPDVFAALENDILPPLIAGRRTCGKSLRIWSAGCCTGEEPYSIAILLGRLIPDLADWHITLRATDINPAFLAKAKQAVYREWSFRGASDWLQRDYFEALEGGRYALCPQLKRLVSFDYLNLVEDVYPSVENDTNAMDVVLCRNVLMYFESATAGAVVQKLKHSLVDGGWLIVSPTETGLPIFGDFAAVRFPETVLYRKEHTAGSRGDFRWGPQDASRVAASFRPSASLFTAPLPPLDIAADSGEGAAPCTLPESLPAPLTSPYQAALADYARGAYDQVVAALTAGGSQDAGSLALLARAYANLGRLADACHCCLEAVRADKFDPGLRFLLASILEEQGHTDEAVVTLKQTLYLDQDFVLAHYTLGNLYRRQGRSGQAAKHLAIAALLLQDYPPDSLLPHAEGLTAGRLLKVIDTAECLP